MKSELAEELLSRVMEWEAGEAADTLPELQTIASYKYDEYRRFEPGGRFIEHLALWLKQFPTKEERARAFDFLKRRLIFISDAELTHLIRILYPDFLRPILRAEVANLYGIPSHMIKAIESHPAFAKILRQSLFLGLSDGARMDEFRRANRGIFSNEQIYPTYEVATQRARSMLDDLGKDLDDENSKFRIAVLVDDFAGSGTSILRFKGDQAAGRIKRFADLLQSDGFREVFEATQTKIVICLLIATQGAIDYLREYIGKIKDPPWSGEPVILSVLTLGENCKMTCESEPEFDLLLHTLYDEDALMNVHRENGGGSMVHGYGDGGLPLVLAHNTPNNSVYLLWESRSGKYVPLFERVDRHIEKSP